MLNSKGFSMIGLMAVVAIIGILAIASMPVYNQYIERTKVSKEIPVIGTYKQDIAACFMKKDSLDDCNDGESGVHPGLENDGKIMSLDVFEGNIVVIIDAQNHVTDTSPVELMYIVDPSLTPTSAALNWNLYCNDYNESNNALVKECKGLITDKDGDGYDDSIEEEWNSDPLDPDNVPENWEEIAPTFTNWTNSGGRDYTAWSPSPSNQTSDFTQTRSYTQEQTRERTERERDSFSGDTRETGVYTETRTISDSESRTYNVTVTNSGSWTDVGSPYGCTNWSPSPTNQTSDFTQTATDCIQDRERTITYNTGATETVSGQTTTSDTRTYNVTVTSSGNWTDVGSPYGCTNWSPSYTNQTSDFTQTATDCTQDRERTVTYNTGATETVSGQTTASDTRTYTVPDTGNDDSGNDDNGNDDSGNDDTGNDDNNSGSGNSIVNYTDWVKYNTSCSPWDKKPSDFREGFSFVAKKECTDYLERYKITKINGIEDSRVRETDTSERTVYKTFIGTKEEPKQCSYSKNGSKSYIFEDRIGTASEGTAKNWARMYWEGNYIPADTNCLSFGPCATYSSIPFDYNGYRYSLGSVKDYDSPDYFGAQSRYYEICRERI